MGFYLIVGSATLFLCLGVIFVIRGLQFSSPQRDEGLRDQQDVVPLADIKEISELKKIEARQVEPKPVKPPLSLIKYLIKESRRSARSFKYEPGQERPKDIFIVKNEKLSSPKVHPAPSFDSDSWQKPLQEATEQLKQSKESCDTLKQQNKEFKRQLEEDNLRFQRLEKNIEQLKKGFEQEKNREVFKIKALEHEVTRLQHEREQLVYDSASFEKLKESNLRLSERIRLSDERMRELLENMDSTRVHSEENLKQAYAIIETLKIQQQQFQKVQEHAYQQNLQEVSGKIVVLEKEKEELQGAKIALKAEFEKIKQYNAELLAKERILQYELAKSRAQAVGLEKVCQDLKSMVEEVHQGR